MGKMIDNETRMITSEDHGQTWRLWKVCILLWYIKAFETLPGKKLFKYK